MEEVEAEGLCGDRKRRWATQNPLGHCGVSNVSYFSSEGKHSRLLNRGFELIHVLKELFWGLCLRKGAEGGQK